MPIIPSKFFVAAASFIFIFNNASFAQTTPTITSFAPTSGVAGTVVTILGTNFSSTAANNNVFFGATRASVISASTTQLTVLVPNGATYGPLVEINTTTGLLAYSKTNFTPTFAPNKTTIETTDFDTKIDFPDGPGIQPVFVSLGDLDDDGKTDMVVANYKGNSVSVYRNTGSNGTVSFATKQDFNTDVGPRAVAIGDLDGDGKPDLAVANYDVSSVSLLRNISSSGNLNFAAKVDLAQAPTAPIKLVLPISVSIGDLDGDGKADLAVVNAQGTLSATAPSSILVFRNTASIGTITTSSVEAPVQFSAGIFSRSIALGDLDGDGKTDMVVANQGGNSVSVLRNTSSPTKVSFDPKVDFTAGTGAQFVAIGDLDGDGKADLAVANLLVSTVSLLRNTSTSGSITASSFAAKVDFVTGSFSYSVALGDLNGDGKVEIAVTNNSTTTGTSQISVFRNVSTSGSITSSSFATKVDLPTGKDPFSVAVGDLDEDGRPDLATANFSDGTVSVIHTNPVLPLSVISFTSTTGAVGTVLTIIGTGFSTTPGNNIVTINGTQAVVTASTSTSMTITVPPGATTGTITVSVGGISATSSNVFTVTPPLAIMSFTPTTGPIGTTVTISGTGFSTILDNNTVTFNGTTAIVTASTSTSITVTVPPGATTGTISVTVGGIKVTSSNSFTVTTDPLINSNDIIVYNAVSPNNDGKNDFFRLQNIDTISPKNEVVIYNRWGDEVFSISDYDNKTKAFVGMTNGGGKLPSGTYFYKIILLNTTKTITGFLSLKL
jgi:gliding motility-associated-like protein